mgnify:CR=1 FL=1
MGQPEPSASLPESAELAETLAEDACVVFVLGGPGSGKGTQCERLVAKYGVKHLSAGDLLRAEVASGSEVGQQCQEIMKEGKLVPTEVTLGLLKKAMVASGQKIFIIDGFPRAVDQGEAFEASIKPCDFVLFLDCPKETMQERLLKRGETSGRADDNLETIGKRFDTFMEVSMPVMDHFAAKVHTVSSVPSPDDVFAEVCKVFESQGIKPADDAAAAEGSIAPQEGEGAPQEEDTTPATPEGKAEGLPEEAAEASKEEEGIGEESQYYDMKNFSTGMAQGEMPREGLRLLHSFGFNARKRNNILYQNGDTIMYAIGNILVIMNASTLEQTFLPGLGGGGIGCICMHPSGDYFAVGEICQRPNVFIYEYPSLQLSKVLRNGTEAEYATLKFSPDGDHLATVGSYPDFMITVWQWKKEHVVLRSKAFSQEIFDVSFSPYLSGILTTCGTGHIRFWKMATTFTGLKLQGEIGKFGKVEISDIAGFIEFPDGKVLSGTETGDMLIWTSGQIKVTVYRKGKKPCHDGMIETIRLTKDENVIVTSGMDGFVRYWDFSELDGAEAEEGSDYVEVTPLKEVSIQGSRIKHIVYAEDHWLVQDEGGSLLKYSLQDRSTTKLLDFHSNSITAMATLPNSHHALTAGADGAVNLYDIRKRKIVIKSTFHCGATSILVLGPKADPTGRTVIVGFEDGVVRVLLRCQDTWKLIGAFKPHKEPITSLAASVDGKQLATVSSDSTVFFFTNTADRRFAPVGFMKLPSPATSIAWNSSCTQLLVGCSKGQVLEIEKPNPAEIDTSVTFLIELKCQEYKFVKPVQKADSGEAKEGEDGAEVGQDENDAESEQVREVEEESYPVCKVLYKADGSGNFYLAMGGSAEGFLYECSFQDEGVLEKVSSHPNRCRDLKYSHSGMYLLSAALDSIRIQRSTLDGSFWSSSVHNTASGLVSSVSTSFDDTYLLSTGLDGSFFIQEFKANDSAPQEGESASLLKAALEPTSSVPDITVAGHYTIEEAKQKTEEDNLLAAAERHKDNVRKQVAALREEFEALLEANRQAQSDEQLPREAFDVDPDLKNLIEAERAEQLERARNELQWEAERARVALKKIKARYLDDVEVERVLLFAFRGDSRASTFRTRKFPASLRTEIAEFHAQGEADGVHICEEKEGGDGEGRDAGLAVAGEHADGWNAALAQDEDGEQQPLQKQELRRLQRKKREEQWAQFNKTKPDESYENPNDAAMIKEAIENMGDFKLKSDPNYIVPEDQRVNATKKRTQMLLLEESIHSIKTDFNDRFLSLRDVKKRIIEDVNATYDRLKDIDKALGHEDDYTYLSLQEAEVPEKRYEITEDELQAFAEHKRMEDEKAKAAASGGFAAGGGSTAPSKQEAAAKADSKLSKRLAPKKEAPKSTQNYAMSELEAVEKRMECRKMAHEKKKLLKQVDYMLSTFDNALVALRQEKFQLQADLKSADMKRLILYKELVLLKEFEKRDTELKRKLDNKLKEQSEAEGKISECLEKLQERKEEIERVMAKKEAVVKEFDGLVEESNSFREPLLKIFLRKIKRIKRKAKEMDDYDSDEEEEEDDDDDFEDDEFDDDDDIEEVCPPGCDQTLYEKVCDLREKRLDQEDATADIQKQTEALRKERETLNKKQKFVEQSMKAVNSEITQFQKEKQSKLNEIDVIITLKMHQVEFLEKGRLPTDLGQGLVFSGKSLESLRGRVKDLVQEKAALKRQQKELRKEHVQLQRSKKAKEQKIVELEKKAKDVQMLKFGQIIDLDLLDRIGESKGAEDLRESLQKQEAQHRKELAEWDRKIDKAMQELAVVTQENTNYLNSIADLTTKHRNLEASLSARKDNLFSNPITKRREEKAERDRLVEVVNTQATVIEKLKVEIHHLRHKP